MNKIFTFLGVKQVRDSPQEIGLGDSESVLVKSEPLAENSDLFFVET